MKKQSMKKNYIYNLIYQLFMIVLPIITTPYLSRVLGVENIGIYSYTLSIVTYFVLFGTLGISLYGQREIAYLQDDEEKRSIKFFELLILKTISMIVAIIIFSLLFTIDNKYDVYYRILIIEMVANIFDISWLYQGLEQFKSIILKNTIVKILGIILIFVFVRTPNDLWKYILIYTGFNLLGNISLWADLRKYIIRIDIKKINIKKIIIPVIMLMIPQIAIQIYTVLDKTMIGFILNDMTEVGYYEQSQKIIKAALTIVTALGTLMIPKISNIFAKGDKNQLKDNIILSFNFTLFLAFSIMFGIVAISYDFVPWFYGPGYNQVKYLLIVFSPMVLFIGVSNILGVQYLVPTKKQNLLTISVVSASLINVLMNMLLIPIYKSTGAAIASVIAEFSVCLIQFYFVRKTINIFDILRLSTKYLISGLVMCIVVIFVSRFLPATIIATIIEIVVGTIIYIGVLVILKDDFTNSQIKSMFKNKRI